MSELKYPQLSNDEAHDGCGLGHGDQAQCRYVVFGERSFECGRNEDRLKRVLEGNTGYSAQRLPAELYPLCQLGKMPGTQRR